MLTRHLASTALALILAAPAAFAADTDADAPGDKIEQAQNDGVDKRMGDEASETADTDQAMPTEDAAPVFSDAQVDAFATAVIVMEGIRRDYLPKLEQAQDQRAQEALMQEANSAMRGAIASIDGLTADEYVMIAQAAQQDAELNQEIRSRIQSLAAEDAG